MDREQNISNVLAAISREVTALKAAQPIEPAALTFYKYSGAWGHDGMSPKYIVFTANNSLADAVVQFLYKAPSAMNYLYSEREHPTGVYYVDVSFVPLASTEYYIVSTVKGSVSITSTPPV